LVEYGFRKGQWHRAYDIWSDLGIGSPHKVYLGSAIRGQEGRIGEVGLDIFNGASPIPQIVN